MILPNAHDIGICYYWQVYALSFIHYLHSLDRYLLSLYYNLGTVLSPADTALNKTYENFCCFGACILVGR